MEDCCKESFRLLVPVSVIAVFPFTRAVFHGVSRGLSMVLLGPTIPYNSMPCKRPTDRANLTRAAYLLSQSRYSAVKYSSSYVTITKIGMVLPINTVFDKIHLLFGTWPFFSRHGSGKS
jgi:hypothetical protein